MGFILLCRFFLGKLREQFKILLKRSTGKVWTTFTNNNNYWKEISVSFGGAWLAKVELFKNFIMLLLFFAVLIDTSRQKFPRFNNRNKLEIEAGTMSPRLVYSIA